VAFRPSIASTTSSISRISSLAPSLLRRGLFVSRQTHPQFPGLVVRRCLQSPTAPIPTQSKARTPKFRPAMYEELLIQPTPAGIQTAAHILQQGGLVAFPTETVYGLGANALNSASVLSIFTAKGRPLTDPLIVHVPTMDKALELLELHAEEEKRVVGLLGERFWPGPLTIITKAAACIPMTVTADTGFVGKFHVQCCV
jgi:hypothetical protein